ncbi:MAG: metallophosphoesterase [bacterium]
MWEALKLLKKGYGRKEIKKKTNISDWRLATLYTIREQAIPEALILLLSDLHFGSNDLHEDFEEIFLNNLKQVLNNTYSFKNIKEVYIFELGDIIDNILHSQQREVNENLSKALSKARSFLRSILELVEPDYYYYIEGNHDRATKDLTIKHYYNDFLYEILKEEFKETKFIKLEGIVSILGWNIFASHGTTLRTLTGEVSPLSISRKTFNIMSLYLRYSNDKAIIPEIFFFGHLHKMAYINTGYQMIFINGTSHQKQFHTSNYKIESLAQFLLSLPPKSFCINKDGILRPTMGNPTMVWCI